MINSLPNKIDELEMRAIAPYIEIEKDISNTQNLDQILKNRKMRKLITKTHKHMASLIQAKKSKYIR